MKPFYLIAKFTADLLTVLLCFAAINACFCCLLKQKKLLDNKVFITSYHVLIVLQLGRIEDIYPWLSETIFPNVYPLNAYNGDVLSLYDQQFIANIDGLLMGPVRMKQNRDMESMLLECIY